MSNEHFAYGLPYSSVRFHRYAPQAASAGSYQPQSLSSSAPYYGQTATAEAPAMFGAPAYQSQRYTQQGPSNGGANFNWYGSAMEGPVSSHWRDTMSSEDIGKEQPQASARFSNPTLYDTPNVVNYAYPPSSNYASNRVGLHEGAMGTSNQGANCSQTSIEDVNIRIPYQPYSWNAERSGMGGSDSNLSQQRMAHSGRHIPPEQASDMRPHLPPSQPETDSITSASSYSCYNSNLAWTRSNIPARTSSDDMESAPRHEVHNSPSLQYGLQGNQRPGLHNFHDQTIRGTLSPPAVAQVMKRQAAARRAKQKKSKTSSSTNLQQPAPHFRSPDMAQYTNSSGVTPASDDVQPIVQSQMEKTYSLSQNPRSYSAHPVVSEYQSTSSNDRSQVQEDSASTISRDPLEILRTPSVTVPVTVDPSHVYNRYHEYQKQIEAADAEHARLAALKAEREAAKAAAAALAFAESTSQTKNMPHSLYENERTHDNDGGLSETEDQPHSNHLNSLTLSSGNQATNCNIPDKQPPTLDPQKVATMEEEMRLMVEKMRQYQNQDPQLFAHVWETVKKNQTPKPMQAQILVGEDFISTSIESQDKQRSSAIDKTFTHDPPPIQRSDGTIVLAKPPQKRKSRSKAAFAQQAADGSERSRVDGKQTAADVASTAVTPCSDIHTPSKTGQGSPRSNKDPQDHITTTIQSSAVPITEQVELFNSAQRHAPTNTSPKTLLIPSNQHQVNSTNHTLIDPALLGQSSETVRSSTVAVDKNTSAMPSQSPGTSWHPTSRGQSKTGVMWPDEHKDDIAKTAAKVLKTIPENAGMTIAPSQILNMLGYNPNYIELCELVEGVGFKLDRAKLAKTILAAIPALNATAVQAAESRTPQGLNRPETSAEFPTLDGTKGSSGIGPSNEAAGHARSDLVEAKSPVSIIRHSDTGQDSNISIGKGPGSRGPYRKTKERMLEAQRASPNSEPRRGPGRPRKQRLPKFSNSALNQNLVVDPALVDQQNSNFQVTTQRASQVPFNATFSNPHNSVEERLVIALNGEVQNDKDQLATGSNAIITLPIATHQDLLNLEPQRGRSEGQSRTGWRTYALSIPTVGVDASVVPSASLPPTPLTKEMVARKRTFAEIIDLTFEGILEPLEDHPSNESKVRRVGNTNFEGADGYDGAQKPETQNVSTQHQSFHLPITTAATSVPNPSLSRYYPPPALAVAPIIPNPYKDFQDIVKPLDRSVALRKSRYDPKTIARDILIATARHPFQRGLNAHLEPLKNRFAKVDDLSDLSTFRWDTVDPSGQPVGSANMSTTSEEGHNRSSLGVVDSSLSRGALDGATLPVGRGPLRPTRGGSPLYGKGSISLQQTQMWTPAQPSGLQFSSTADSGFAVVIESTAANTSLASGLPGMSRPAGTSSASPARRRGRPPRNPSAANQLVTSTPKHIGRPLKPPSSRVGTQGNSDGRKVGRYRSHPLPESKQTGRPRKPNAKPVTPKFIPFLCEWRACKAELHNLETLRRHVYSVHNNVQTSGAIACQWSKCGLTRQVSDGSTHKSTPEPKFVHEDHEFAGMEEFKNHMEKAHLIPFAWHMGDGPRSSTLDGSESDPAAYLSDAAGNQVTPSIASQTVEDGNARFNNARRCVLPKILFDRALQMPIALIRPGKKVKFSSRTEWRTIKAPPLSEWVKARPWQ